MKSNDKIEYYNKLIKEINNNITLLLKESPSQSKQLRKMYDEVQELKRSLRKNSLGFSYIEIDFDGEFELQLPKYGIENFDRKLKGLMYFKVVNSNNNYMDLRTSSMPKTFVIRLYYSTLKDFKKQREKGLLIYRRGREKLIGPEESINYSIRKKK